ncbi:hypothetical protein CEUSTIGMA_g3730.t1 [Chlamydomonas eustigma]|uniref:Uncharacterized protein n=1 Tax=Chlamydomonas eustigma TaxID=1157962 RepID=A0A250WZR9_9CHLO|nr:hypothetical protein CEUSTIGMA_g3730.t1 [Chlamydomonas eustigma]|eukprot:GAX76285.1 hypothetical protein CEUSTIGMA_g3730.t1 [Chlamydomonas eustigma]
MLEDLNSEDRAKFQEDYESMMSAMQVEAFQNMDDEHMKAYVDVVLSKWTNPSFWEATLVEPMALDVIRERLTPEQSEILGKLLVSDEKTGDIGKGLNTNRPSMIGRALLKLKRHERKLLPGLLERLDEIQIAFQVLGERQEYEEVKAAARMERRRKQKGLEVESDQLSSQSTDMQSQETLGTPDLPQEDIEKYSAERLGSAVGASPRTESGQQAVRGGDSLGRKWGQSLVSRRRKAPNNGAAGVDAELQFNIGGYSQSKGDSRGQTAGEGTEPSRQSIALAEMIAEKMGRYSDIQSWEEEGVEDSLDLRRLKSLTLKLVALARINLDNIEGSGLTQKEFLYELQVAMQEVDYLQQTGVDSEDVVVRETVAYMVTQLSSQNKEGEDVLDCTPEVMERLTKFIRAAEVWKELKAFYAVFQRKKPLGGNLPESLFDQMVAIESMQQSVWWLMRVEREPQHGADELDGEMYAVNEELIENLIVTDPLELRFLCDLMDNDNSEEVLIKWSLHPVLGPKMRSGLWFPGAGQSDEAGDMPEMVRQAMREANEGLPPMPEVDNLTQEDKEALLVQMLGMSTAKVENSKSTSSKRGGRKVSSMRSSKQALLKSKRLLERTHQERNVQ